MFRVEHTVMEKLKKLQCDTEEVKNVHFVDMFEVGRKTVYQCDECIVIIEPKVSAVIGFKNIMSNNMNMYPHTYQDIGFQNGTALMNVAKALYFEKDPLLPVDDVEDVSLWGYLAQIVYVTIERWKCTHPVVFELLKEIEQICKHCQVGRESIHFLETMDIDILLRVDSVDNELTKIFRFNVWDHDYGQYLDWFENLPLLFESQVE